MPGIIKGGLGGGYVYSNSFDEKPVMRTIYGRRPKAPDTRDSSESGSEEKKEQKEETAAPLPKKETVLDEAALARTVSVEEARIEREQLQAEYEAMRNRYEQEAEKFVMRAKDKATEIYDKTKQIAAKTVLDARDEAEQIRKKAAIEAKALGEQSKAQGYEEGHKQGFDEGYMKALKKCKESLLELKELSEQVTEAKSELLMQYERQLFDTIFEIVQKITVNALGQRDKGVITRMIREAGKKYRTSKNVKITLSKLDISDEAQIDEQLLKEVFKSSENIEIELQEDAPQGTLLIDDGSELTDASVMTQLKMVEQLGKGKYRDTNLTDMLQQTSAGGKARRTAKKKSDDKKSGGEDEQGVPDVVYKTGDNDAGDETEV